MHAYLIIGKDSQSKKKQVESILKRTGSALLEFPISKISDTRELSKFLKLTINKKTSILVSDIDKATNESLNAFLKNLEEPQKNITYILTASSEHRVLPTIKSRCLLIFTGSKQKGVEKKLAENFLKLTTSEKLLEVSKIKARDDAIDYLQNLLNSLHLLLIKGKHTINTADTIKGAQNALNALNANGNVSLQLANFVINN
jgi:DNA polymerase III delta prime subunit